MTGVQRQAADLLQRLKKMDFSLAKKKGQHLDIGELEIIQMALEKQVPEKPAAIDEDLGYFICSRCEAAITWTADRGDHKYCLNCGQAIDWRNI